ncbi:MAG: 50S ribosomal protein L23, partial [Proteobacteria bacterium]
EKANTVAEKHEQVVFKVLPQATKQEIKAAFELAFNAEVLAVSVTNVKGKAKRFGRYAGRRANWKKAYISLKPGQSFDLAANQK